MANQIAALPDEIGLLRNLSRLGLKGNLLSALPATVGGLTALVRRLDGSKIPPRLVA